MAKGSREEEEKQADVLYLRPQQLIQIAVLYALQRLRGRHRTREVQQIVPIST